MIGQAYTKKREQQHYRKATSEYIQLLVETIDEDDFSFSRGIG